ncbi:MAG: hypothetical protein AAF790_13060, partial [Planctomycetota bacterium]
MAEAVARKRTHRRDRVARWFLLTLGGLLIAGMLAPAIIGHTPLRDAALAGALPPGAGTLAAADASLGWFSPTTLTGVTLTAPDGRLVLHADAATTDRSVWRLLTSPADLGVITVTRPALYAVAGPGGSSLEDLIAELTREGDPGGPGADAGGSTRMTLVIRGGSLAVTDSVTGVTQVHGPIDADATIGGPGGGRLVGLQVQGVLSAAVLPAGAPPPA